MYVYISIHMHICITTLCHQQNMPLFFWLNHDIQDFGCAMLQSLESWCSVGNPSIGWENQEDTRK